MISDLEVSAPFDLLFSATAEGIELQRQIDSAKQAGQAAIQMALSSFANTEAAETVSQRQELSVQAYEAIATLASGVRLESELSEKEQVVAKQLAGMHLSVRVIGGEGSKPIRKTLYSGGAFGPRAQILDGRKTKHKNGTFRTALLGQNLLVLYPQWMNMDQTSEGNIVVPILREDGEPNIQLQQRERTWRDRMPNRMDRRYKRSAGEDIQRFRQIATEL